MTAVTADGADYSARVRVVERSALIERYAPILHYDEAERYLPTRYEAFFHHSSLVRATGADPPRVLVRRPTVFDLAGRGDATALVLDGRPAAYHAYDDAYDATVYASVRRDVPYGGERYTAITYWLFYLFDPKVGSYTEFAAHQSDVESVTVLVNASGPQWVGASQHYGGAVIEWEKTGHTGTNLHVYPAVGAHSNYLVNTGAYNGSGIFVQVQHVVGRAGPDPGGSSFSPLYADTTGDDVVLRHDGTLASGSYELVPLTGTERWASFRGGMEGTPGKGSIPMQQPRWAAPGEWMASLVADESQVTFVSELLSLDLSPTALNGSLEFQNLGPKPRTVWTVIDAKPASSNWTTGSTVTLLSEPVAVGVGEVRNVTYSGAYPTEGAARWDLRLRLLGYAPRLSESEDVLFDYRTGYPADVPAAGVDLAAEAPTSRSWHLPLFVSKYLGGAPVLLWFLAGGLLFVVLRRIRARERSRRDRPRR